MQEVHIIHPFAHDFYGHDMSVLVLGYIRPELDYISTGTFLRHCHSGKLIKQKHSSTISTLMSRLLSIVWPGQSMPVSLRIPDLRVSFCLIEPRGYCNHAWLALSVNAWMLSLSFSFLSIIPTQQISLRSLVAGRLRRRSLFH